MNQPIRLALLRDFVEENWASMDIVGEAISTYLDRLHAAEVETTTILPTFRRRFTSFAPAGTGRFADRAFNADRLLNRFVDYPRAVKRLVRDRRFDVYHLVDHSYAQLVHELPAARTVVTCHDLDTFRSLLEPDREPRPAWFRAMTRRTLEGLKKAAVVVCVSEATRRELCRFNLVDDKRLRVVPNGIFAEFTADEDRQATLEIDRLLGPKRDDAPELLHVGSNIPRKRIDVLLETFAGIRRAIPTARLVKIGGALTPEQEELARALDLGDSLQVLPGRLKTLALAAIYRRADLVLFPSDAEGFGLPVAEALACGATVLASDLDVLREVGGSAVVYRPVADVRSWTEAALELLESRRLQDDSFQTRRRAGLAQASRFQWPAHVASLVEIYREVLTA